MTDRDSAILSKTASAGVLMEDDRFHLYNHRRAELDLKTGAAKEWYDVVDVIDERVYTVTGDEVRNGPSDNRLVRFVQSEVCGWQDRQDR